jgi:hypothetical protein
MYLLHLVAYKMSQLDTELTLLKQKLAALEEQKRIELEKETEKKENPLKVLEEILNEKKKWIHDTNTIIKEKDKYADNRMYYFKQLNQVTYNYLNPEIHYFNEQDKLAILEPIFNMLQDIQKRLDALEKKE